MHLSDSFACGAPSVASSSAAFALLLAHVCCQSLRTRHLRAVAAVPRPCSTRILSARASARLHTSRTRFAVVPGPWKTSSSSQRRRLEDERRAPFWAKRPPPPPTRPRRQSAMAAPARARAMTSPSAKASTAGPRPSVGRGTTSHLLAAQRSTRCSRNAEGSNLGACTRLASGIKSSSATTTAHERPGGRCYRPASWRPPHTQLSAAAARLHTVAVGASSSLKMMAARLTLTDHREGTVSEAASENSSFLSMFGGCVLRSEVFQSCLSGRRPDKVGLPLCDDGPQWTKYPRYARFACWRGMRPRSGTVASPARALSRSCARVDFVHAVTAPAVGHQESSAPPTRAR